VPSEGVRTLCDFADGLEKRGVPFVVGGSVASSAWGQPRSTHDVDVLVRLKLEEVAGLAAELARRFLVDEELMRSAVRRARAFNAIHSELFHKVDVFVAGQSALDAAQLERPVLRRLASDMERNFPVTAPEVLVLRKLDWFRKGDHTSQRQWHDVLAVLRVQGERLDRGWMEALAGECGLADLLERAGREARGQ